MKVKSAIAVLLTSSFLFFSVEIPKRAFRFYDKGDLEKTVEALEKSLSKDTLNPAANYLYARLFVDTAFWGYNIDSAYLYINEAIYDYGFVTESKDLGNLAEVGVDSTNLELRKDLIDSLQYEVIKGKHTIDDYNWFMQNHADAAQVPDAIYRRNHIAFEDAEKVNTWQSYLGFMQEYPESYDFGIAEERYKKLIFEERTADGKLKSYTEFLEEFPATPYREIAEQQIFEISTSVNTLEAYTQFLREYPNEKLAQKIYPRLYHLYKELYGNEKFLEHFNIAALNDSLPAVMALEESFWLPKLDNEKYTFFTQDGKSTNVSGLTGLNTNCICDPIATDFVYGLEDGLPKLYARNGTLLAEGVFDIVRDEGYGFVTLSSTQGERLIHKSKEVIIDEPMQSIRVLNQHLIRTQKNDLYGLTTINGRRVLDHELTDIDTLMDYLWIEKKGMLGLVRSEVFFPAIDGDPVSLSFPYEEIEVLDNGLLWVIKDGLEGVLDAELNPVVPFGKYSIYDREYGWLLKGDSTQTMLHKAYPFLNDIRYDKLLENSQWIATKKDSSWTLIDRLGQLPIAEGYDSLSFLGENMVMLYKGDEVRAQFRNGKQLPMEKAWEPRLLVPQNYIKTGETALYDFFMLSNFKDYRRVYNTQGREILSATYKEVTAMGPNLLRLQKRNTALVDSTGNFVLKFIYDGVGSYDRGYVSIVKDGKVGILNIAKDLTIKPTYESLITPYTDSILMARKNNYIGFINDENQQLSGFDFDEVTYWNDSVALVRIEKEWLLHDITNEAVIYDRITDYRYLEESETEKRILVTKESGKGIYSSTKGELIEATYDDIKVLGTEATPIYFAVKIVAEANIYVVIYFDADGNKLFTLTYPQDQYLNIACPDK